MESLFEKTGHKIKVMAVVLFVLEVVICIISAIILLVSNALGYAALVFFCGPLVAWMSSIITYGFGIVVEKISSIEITLQTPDKSLSQEERIKKAQDLLDNNQITAEEYKKAIDRINN